MPHLSKTPNGERIVAETGGARMTARVEVATRGGEALLWRGCKPGDNVFAKLVKAAREHCAT